MYDNSRESSPTKMEGNGDGTRTQAFLTLKLRVFPNIYTAYLMVSLQKASPGDQQEHEYICSNYY